MIIGLALNRGDIPIELGDSWLTNKTMKVVVLVKTKQSTVTIIISGILYLSNQ